MKARIAFDTLAYAKRLEAAGVEKKIAEAQAEANADLIANLLDDTLATKKDIADLALATKQNISELALATKQDIAQIEIKLERQISDLEKEIQEVKSKFPEYEARLTLRLGTIMVTTITIATTVLSFLHVVH